MMVSRKSVNSKSKNKLEVRYIDTSVISFMYTINLSEFFILLAHILILMTLDNKANNQFTRSIHTTKLLYPRSIQTPQITNFTKSPQIRVRMKCTMIQLSLLNPNQHQKGGKKKTELQLLGQKIKIQLQQLRKNIQTEPNFSKCNSKQSHRGFQHYYITSRKKEPDLLQFYSKVPTNLSIYHLPNKKKERDLIIAAIHCDPYREREESVYEQPYRAFERWNRRRVPSQTRHVSNRPISEHRERIAKSLNQKRKEEEEDQKQEEEREGFFQRERERETLFDGLFVVSNVVNGCRELPVERPADVESHQQKKQQCSGSKRNPSCS